MLNPTQRASLCPPYPLGSHILNLTKAIRASIQTRTSQDTIAQPRTGIAESYQHTGSAATQRQRSNTDGLQASSQAAQSQSYQESQLHPALRLIVLDSDCAHRFQLLGLLSSV